MGGKCELFEPTWCYSSIQRSKFKLWLKLTIGILLATRLLNKFHRHRRFRSCCVALGTTRR